MSEIINDDALTALRAMPDNSVDSIVTDPPYGLSNTSPDKVADTIVRWAQGDREYTPKGRGFMGAAWDAFVPPPAVWDECFRVLKPGGHMVVFAGSRTQDLMGLAIRLANFEIRDNVAWIYGSGFPKSHDIAKGVDKLDAAQERRARALEFTEWMRSTGITSAQVDEITGTNMGGHFLTAASQPAVATADLFDRLRPHLPEVPERIEELVAQRTVESQNYAARTVLGTEARMNEPSGIVGVGQGERTAVTRKITEAYTPEAEKWQGWGTALKPAHEPIILARKPLGGRTVAANTLEWGTGGINVDACRIGMGDEKPPTGSGKHSEFLAQGGGGLGTKQGGNTTPAAGRWPANVVLDPDTAQALDQQSGNRKSGGSTHDRSHAHNGIYGTPSGERQTRREPDEGGASRFFKVAEPDPPFIYAAKAPKRERPTYTGEDGQPVAHPTVKPLSVIRWLARLVTPVGGRVLDPFGGSGTLLEAALLEGMDPVVIEAHGPFIPLIEARRERVATG